MRIWTTAIRGLNGRNDPFPCSLIRLGNRANHKDGGYWQRAEIFHGLGSPAGIIVDAASLFIDRACTVKVLANIERSAAN